MSRSRRDRGTLQHLPAWDRHPHFRTTGDEADKLLDGVWDVPAQRGVPDELLRALDAYVRVLLASGYSLHRSDLVRTLSRMPQQVVLPWEVAVGPADLSAP